MPRRQNRAQQHNENRYQINRDKQYKQFLGVAQAVSKSLEQYNVFDFDITSHDIPPTPVSALQYSELRFDTTQKCLLGLLLLTAVGSLIPRANAMPAADINDTNSLVSRDSFSPRVNATEMVPLQISTQATQYRKKFLNKASQSIGLFRHPRKSVAVVNNLVDKFYCATQIHCPTKGVVPACNYTVDSPQYWDHVSYFGSDLEVGRYNFTGALAPYHAPTVPSVVCQYQNGLYLYAKLESNLEAYYDTTTAWGIDGTIAQCNSKSPQACPLKEAYSLALFNNNINASLTVTANGDNLSSIKINMNTPYGAAVRYEDVAPYCLTDSQCKIDLLREKVVIGSAIVNITNAMKILQVLSFPYTGIKTTQINPFNTIELKKIDNPPVDNSSITIINNINSAISASANSTPVIDKPIPSKAWGGVFFERALLACKNITKCKIGIGLWNTSESIGSVTVNMTGNENMKILEVDSAVPTEIDIKQVGSSNTVEVDYPNRSMRRR